MNKYILTVLTAFLFFSGCAAGERASANRQLDEKLARETSVKTRADLRKEATSIITTAPGLTDQQRASLMELRDSSSSETDRLTTLSLKLRSVLVKELLNTNSDPELVDLIKARIKKVEQERVSLFFRTIHGVNTILGRWGSRTERENQEFFDQMMLETMDLYYM